ncbi:unnamed protein product [Rotaria sp. Silwood2]|nr:unnamed protein product [Rotaria sp. Silwood2]
MHYLNFVGPLLQSFSEARGAAASVFRFIDEGNDTNANEIDVWKEDIEALDNIKGNVEFDNVNFSYPSRKDVSVLHNLSLIARVGRTTALVGSSGCGKYFQKQKLYNDLIYVNNLSIGKSTCISLFLRYYEPSSGRIMIDGRPITHYNVKQLRQNIGVVSQEPILFGTSIYENIRFGKVNATRTEIEQAAREANAHNFIMQLPDKYETLVGERGIQLSGGEKQRIALARALVKQPTFLLLDEATSALDNVNEKIVQEALDRACREAQGAAVSVFQLVDEVNSTKFSLSIYENIRFGKVNATRAEIEEAAREANAHNFIMQLPNKYETLVGERGVQLSGGEKQRIALARALVRHPTILLLDEATSALDNVNEKIVQEALNRACRGRTTIVIAHRLTTIQNADQIYVLDNGSVIEQGTHETLMAKRRGKYQAMVKRQQIEKINDDKDGMMTMQQTKEEDDISISIFIVSC